MHRSSTSMYIPNFIEIGKLFVDGCTVVPAIFCRAHNRDRQTDRQTDRPRYSVCNKRLHRTSDVTRPNNNNNLTYKACIFKRNSKTEAINKLSFCQSAITVYMHYTLTMFIAGEINLTVHKCKLHQSLTSNMWLQVNKYLKNKYKF